jgi:hypothetical protein
MFPTALAAASGWPAARLVLCAAPPKLGRALRMGRVSDTVPFVPSLGEAGPALIVGRGG